MTPTTLPPAGDAPPGAVSRGNDASRRDDVSDGDESRRESVSRKAERIQRDRSRPQAIWRYAQMVGAVGWTFVLPVVAAAFGARALVRLTERPGAGLGLIVAGVVFGGWAAARQLQRFLHHDDNDTPHPGG